MAMSTAEQQLCQYLRDQPRAHNNRFNEHASQTLLSALFWNMAGGEPRYMHLFFPEGAPKSAWNLRQAQGAVDGAEYTEAARGKACGHIFKTGEASYRCKTCSADETCVLCSRCYDSSDHTGHMVYIAISPGNSGCCDCGDAEAWRLPLLCTIHSEHSAQSKSAGKSKGPQGLPQDLIESIQMTIGRAFDYVCDVISCSPEQLRTLKTASTIQSDERLSRLISSDYSGDVLEDPVEYALLLWNDEKHTVTEVRDQVARACKVSEHDAHIRAHETDDIGRSILMYDTDLEKLLKIAKTIEQIKVTVTIRSARDTFREQMCSTIIEWLGDISGCSVGGDSDILRHTVCKEMLKEWRTGSAASNKLVGRMGLDDQEKDDYMEFRRHFQQQREALRIANENAVRAMNQAAPPEEDNEVDSLPEDSDDERERRGVFGFQAHPISDVEEADLNLDERDEEDEEGALGDADLDIDMIEATEGILGPTAAPGGDDDTEMTDGTEGPRRGNHIFPPPPPPMLRRNFQDRDLTPSDSDAGEPLISSTLYAKLNLDIPKTPKNSLNTPKDPPKPGRYWLETPEGFNNQENLPPHEDLRKRVRLDWLILFDLRLWKKVRVALRDLYLFTVVNIPQFKRVLGLRFAALYTTLAQLYLIADREPDHSIINISLQMLTTPSITAEIVERGNFMTNLMAILYTFLTSRQVGHPYQIVPNATLAFEAGSVTNRRMYHFFVDLRYLFSSSHIQERLRLEPRYTMQFLDLVKLHQGICPNTRAVGEHVEYETDAWISASLITREINRLCRQFAESFKWKHGENMVAISTAIRMATQSVIINSVGAERRRFNASEIKNEVTFRKVTDYEFDTSEPPEHYVVKFHIDTEAISFHHALHYTLSWLIEGGKSMSRDQLREIMSFTSQELTQKPRAQGLPASLVMTHERFNSAEDNLMAVFDYPLRVCAWLAQMKAGMWVRNGMSLRHQAATYRGVGQRDVSHHRDIFLLQTAMVLCNPARVLASMIDRFGVEMWMKGIFEYKKSCFMDETHLLDVTEDLIHLLIVLLSDRTSLISTEDSETSHVLAMRRDITHVLCFKPLSFSEICSKLPDKFQEQEECQDILDEMTIFKAPEGLSDVGAFELKPQFLEDIDPYIAHYSKNQREESENAYRAWMAQKSGKKPGDIVFEPKLKPIETGAFSDLSAFTRTGMFAQIIYYSLLYPLNSAALTPTVPSTRVETFLQVVLHLILIAISEDKTAEDDMSEESLGSFVCMAMTKKARSNFLPNTPNAKTIVSLLELLAMEDSYKSCHPKIMRVLKRMKQKRPQNYETASYLKDLGFSSRISTASPANDPSAEDADEKKKKMARERQAKVMAQFQQKQKEFMDRQGGNVIDWGEADEDEDEEMQTSQHKNLWKYPSGTCILCQEETNETRPYGTFAMMTTSFILRQTDLSDADFVQEVCSLPADLDRSAEAIRPFGVSGQNREQVRKVNSNGEEHFTERHFVGKGFPPGSTIQGPVTTGCGHIMHYKCFEAYYQSSRRRHQHQIARHHPENLDLNEFCCPLCKALGNAFLPIIWRHKEEMYPGVLQTREHFNNWLMSDIGASLNRNGKSVELQNEGRVARHHYTELYQSYNNENVMLPLASKMSELLIDAWVPSPTPSASLRPGLMATPGAYPSELVAETPTSLHQPWQNSETAMPELVSIYRRLKNTMGKNKLESVYAYDIEQQQQDDLCYTDTLAKSLGFSIAALEIQQRGTGAPVGATLLEKIPQPLLTHLRVLSETATSYVTIGGLKLGGDNRACREFSRSHDRQMFQLFIGHPHIFDIGEELAAIHRTYEPLLSEDCFMFLAKCSVCLSSVSNIDIPHIVRLCYLAELVKIVLTVSRSLPEKVALAWMQPVGLNLSETEISFSDFCATVKRLDAGIMGSAVPSRPQSTGFDENFLARAGSFRSFVQKYALAFLRKSAILLHVRFGVDFSLHVPTNPEGDELCRLTEALALPSFDDLCASMNPVNSASLVSPPLIHSIVTGWIYHHLTYQSGPGQAAPSPKIPTISHPTIFELIGLPKNYDTLMEESTKRRCPTTGKDITDPMICLFCGEIFCGQANCCLKEEVIGRAIRQIGGAQQHMKKCQKHIGLFISIRKCTVYYVYHSSGSWMVAPYIDRYGEVDPGLRHMRQLYLNQKRYDALLRTVWLQHGVPSVISRKLEADINNGGWETI